MNLECIRSQKKQKRIVGRQFIAAGIEDGLDSLDYLEYITLTKILASQKKTY